MMFFKKNKLNLLIITSLLGGLYTQQASAQTISAVDVDGSFTIPQTTQSIENKFNALESDNTVKKYTTPENLYDDEDFLESYHENQISIVGYNILGPSTNEESPNDRSLINKNTLVKFDQYLYDNGRRGIIVVGGGENVDMDNLNIVVNATAYVEGVAGAYSEEGNASNGNVYIISDDASIQYKDYGIAGAMSKQANASNGNVYITAGKVGQNGGYGICGISGACSFQGYSASNGSVYITGGEITSGLIAGVVSWGSSLKGNVYITGGTISNDEYTSYPGITGAMVYSSGSADGNVYISGGDISAKYVAGATVDRGDLDTNAKGNVFFYGNVKIKNIDDTGVNIYGGYLEDNYIDNASDNFNIFNDNLFSIASNPLTVSTVGNFAQYKFYLNQYNQDVINDSSKAMLTVTKTIRNDLTHVNGDLTENKSTVMLAGISKDVMVKKNDEIILIDAGAVTDFLHPNNLGNWDDDTYQDDEKTANISDLFSTKDGDTGEVNVGLIGKADVTYHVDDDKKQIRLTVDNYSVNEVRANKNIKPLADGRLATLQNAVRSAEALQDVMGEHKPMGTFTPIAEISGGINQYSGSTSIESRDYRLVVGSRYQVLDNLYAGVALDYGRSNYSSDNGNKRGEGDISNYGASFFGKYTNSLTLGDLYFDGALRLGRTSADIKSNDVITSSGTFAGYKDKANYIGTTTGLGFIYALSKTSSFDTSAHYLWTHLNSDNVTIDGDDIHFNRANSSKVQFKEQYNYKTTDNLTFTLAGIYEYEFDSKAGASSSNVSIDAPSIQGSTGIVELGIKGTPIAESKDFNFNFKFRGYSGKRNGASASAFFEYDF